MAATCPRKSDCRPVALLALCGLLCWGLPAPPICAAEPAAARAVRELPGHFMLGVTSGPGDRWIAEVQAQGARFDMRYQYLAGGVNTDHPWRSWNEPAGQFALNYFQESDRLGVIPCVTYYEMYQSLPCGAKGDEAQGNKRNCETPATMRVYLEDMKLLLERAGQYGKPVVLHHEPDLWGYMCMNPAFAPNDPDRIRVVVRSSGFAEAARFEDTAAGLGKCIVALRDRYAPRVLLAWHASKWGNPNPRAMAAFFERCGRWDLIFTDPSDRDSGWKVAHGQKESDSWWNERTFAEFREWSGELHRQTGLPLVAWQIPMGNTIMAACNNSDGHYMDNRAEYFLEGYPANRHIAEWAAQGYVGLLFGGGAGGCTDVRDSKKDGVTNPPRVPGNKGERSQFADDDGGYLRLRAANYYAKKPVPLRGRAASPTAKTPAGKGPAAKTPATPPSAARKKMQQVLGAMTEADFTDTPLREVLAYFADRHGIEIRYDEKPIRDAGLSPDAPITVKLKRTSLRSALRLAVSKAKLAYVVGDDALLVTTPEAAKGK
ncbi:MAG: hypothetical protein ABSG86_20925 [Thermoguttaceae bacterium]|jgi:hypothetical protein